jgi:hypothetical protein
MSERKDGWVKNSKKYLYTWVPNVICVEDRREMTLHMGPTCMAHVSHVIARREESNFGERFWNCLE